MPDLSLVPAELWDKVKARQATLTKQHAKEPHAFWEGQRPKFLLSGLMKCGQCRGNYAKISKHLYGCAASRNKSQAVCDNRLNIRGDKIEAYILDALQSRLMDPDLFEEFSRAFIAEINQQRSLSAQTRQSLERELAQTITAIGNVINAIKEGIPAASVKEELAALEARKEKLSKELAQQADNQPLIHPNLATLYRDKVSDLTEAFTGDHRNFEAFDLIRSLIEEVRLTPNAGELDISLHGNLAGILALCDMAPNTQKPALPAEERAMQIKLVAGARNCFHRLFAAPGLMAVQFH